MQEPLEASLFNDTQVADDMQVADTLIKVLIHVLISSFIMLQSE